jgi:hypothetical protein
MILYVREIEIQVCWDVGQMVSMNWIFELGKTELRGKLASKAKVVKLIRSGDQPQFFQLPPTRRRSFVSIPCMGRDESLS